MAIFPRGGNASGEVDEIEIEKRGPRFKTVHHGGAVDFNEDVVLQVELRVKLQRAVDQVGLGAGFPSRDGFSVNVVEIDGFVEEFGEFGGVERGHPDREPEFRPVPQAAEGALEPEIEAHVAVRDGEARGEEADGLVDRTGDEFLVELGLAQGTEGIVTGKEFVAGVPAERDFHLLAGEFAEQVGRQKRTVAHGLVELLRDCWEQGVGFGDGERFGVVVGLKQLGDPARVSGFVERAFFETDAEGFQLPGRNVARGEGGDGGRVDPAAEENSDRHIGDETALDGGVEAGAEFFAPRFFRVVRDFGADERFDDVVPVFFEARREDRIIEIEGERVAPGEFEDVFQNGMRGGDVAVGEVFLQGAPREGSVDRGMSADGGEFGTEDEGAVLRGVEKGFFAEAVAAAEEFSL